MMPQDFEHDFVIIGCGAAGGMAAWNLTRKGAKVLILEAGEKFPGRFLVACEALGSARALRARRASAGVRAPIKESRFQCAEGRIYYWWRVWGIGGKTNIWGRVSLRYSDLNMQEPAKDGWEIDGRSATRSSRPTTTTWRSSSA